MTYCSQDHLGEGGAVLLQAQLASHPGSAHTFVLLLQTVCMQAQLASQLEQVQGALMNKSMELTETTASLRQAAAEEKEGLLKKHRAEREAAAEVCGCECPIAV